MLVGAMGNIIMPIIEEVKSPMVLTMLITTETRIPIIVNMATSMRAIILHHQHGHTSGNSSPIIMILIALGITIFFSMIMPTALGAATPIVIFTILTFMLAGVTIPIAMLWIIMSRAIGAILADSSMAHVMFRRRQCGLLLPMLSEWW